MNSSNVLETVRKCRGRKHTKDNIDCNIQAIVEQQIAITQAETKSTVACVIQDRIPEILAMVDSKLFDRMNRKFLQLYKNRLTACRSGTTDALSACFA